MRIVMVIRDGLEAFGTGIMGTQPMGLHLLKEI